MTQYTTHRISAEERDTILAALRVYQQVYGQAGGDLPDAILAIATNSGVHDGHPEASEIYQAID